MLRGKDWKLSRLQPRPRRKELKQRKLKLKDKDWWQRLLKPELLLNRPNKRPKDSVMKRKKPLVLQPKQNNYV